jgi:SAM-dependent methyltransferase
MTVFGAYSRYYNLLYKDKNYGEEAAYVHGLIQKYAPATKSVLDLGCGTGRHDFELAKAGYAITGVDISEEMLAIAHSNLTTLNDSSAYLNFTRGDIRSVRLDKIFDVVLSLFHVVSYQVSNEDLQSVFAAAKAHLKPGGLFIFDCWYGPAVLTDPPAVRIKRLQDDEILLVRIAEPVTHYNENVVDVNYEVIITDKATGTMEQLRETHRMRYLFRPEVEGLIAQHGFVLLSSLEWMTDQEPTMKSWNVCFVCKSQ